MLSRKCFSVLIAILLAAPGCETDPPAPAPQGHVISSPVYNPQAGPPPQGAPPVGGANGTPQNASAELGARLASSATFPVRLSAGTALPQTGPEGVLMGFSVDYQSPGYQPSAGARCVLVIERGDGKRAEQPAEVAASGTWALIIQGWPPEAGPFQARVEEISEEGSRRALSAFVPLQ
jgi:hypothetical protein